MESKIEEYLQQLLAGKSQNDELLQTKNELLQSKTQIIELSTELSSLKSALTIEQTNCQHYKEKIEEMKNNVEEAIPDLGKEPKQAACSNQDVMKQFNIAIFTGDAMKFLLKPCAQECLSKEICDPEEEEVTSFTQFCILSKRMGVKTFRPKTLKQRTAAVRSYLKFSSMSDKVISFIPPDNVINGWLVFLARNAKALNTIINYGRGLLAYIREETCGQYTSH